MIDAAQLYDKLRKHLKDGRPFVAYRRPDAKVVKAVLQKDASTYRIKNLEESGFVFAPFNPEYSPYYIPLENSEIFEFEDLSQESVDGDLYEFLVKEVDFEYMEEDQKVHENLVQKGIDTIKAGKLKKVVLARTEKVQVHDPDPIRIFKNLLKKYSQAFVYIWFHPETGCWLGATPEALLKTERNRFKTMALAGTQLFKGKIDVEWEKKEVEEQLIVTDYILDYLEKLRGITNVEISKPYSAKAGNLLHIRTDISGLLEDTGKLKELIGALHPTPAVCGIPKEKALNFILKNEDISREFYSGYLGELNMKKETRRSANKKNQENQQFSSISPTTDLFVNLRCMKLKEGYARIFVGGGITKDSNAADEWMETVNKSQTMKDVLVK